MHPTSGYEPAKVRIADLRRQAQREGPARAAAHLSPSAPQPSRNRIPVTFRSWFGNRRPAHQTGVMPRPAREPRGKHGSHQSRRVTMSAASYDLSISAAGAYGDLRHQRLGLVGAAAPAGRAVRQA
jgi:hypothetical protein